MEQAEVHKLQVHEVEPLKGGEKTEQRNWEELSVRVTERLVCVCVCDQLHLIWKQQTNTNKFVQSEAIRC